MTQRHKISKCCWKNAAVRLARCRVATNLQFVKKRASAHNKTKYACTCQVLLCFVYLNTYEFLSSQMSILLSHQCFLSYSLIHALMRLYLLLAKCLILQAHTLSVIEPACVNEWKTRLFIVLEIGSAEKGHEFEPSWSHLSPGKGIHMTSWLQSTVPGTTILKTCMS